MKEEEERKGGRDEGEDKEGVTGEVEDLDFEEEAKRQHQRPKIIIKIDSIIRHGSTVSIFLSEIV
jgi:hypothetical protein